MRDGEDIQERENPLEQVISHIHTKLYETYAEYDREATDKHQYHRWFSGFAVFFGTLSILLSILQVFLKAYPDSFLNNPELAIFEKGALLAAILAIVIALGSRLLRGWLTKRYMAEQCRTLKFRALIHPYLSFSSDDTWTDRFSQWKNRFDNKVAYLKTKEDDTLEKILVTDKIHDPPHDTSGSPLNVPYLTMLVDYYQEKRISTQIKYFSTRAREFRTSNKNTERIPQYCFIGGVVGAGAQFFIEVFNSWFLAFMTETTVKTLQAGILLIILILPSIGVAFKTLRSSVEVSRNASLFSAKCRALNQFATRLTEEREKENVNWPEILKIMWECENFFESENKEWLRIMHDAEWFL